LPFSPFLLCNFSRSSITLFYLSYFCFFEVEVLKYHSVRKGHKKKTFKAWPLFYQNRTLLLAPISARIPPSPNHLGLIRIDEEACLVCPLIVSVIVTHVVLKLILTLGFPKQLETDVHSALSVQDTGRILALPRVGPLRSGGVRGWGKTYKKVQIGDQRSFINYLRGKPPDRINVARPSTKEKEGWGVYFLFIFFVVVIVTIFIIAIIFFFT
jgi:hypothetical protein